MTTVEAPNAPDTDVYDPDKDALSRGSPPLMKIEPRWKPSPSPHQDSPDSESDESTESASPDLEKSQPKRMKPIATQGDAVLLSLLGSGNGNTNDVAQEAARRTLPTADEDVDMVVNDQVPVAVRQEDFQEKDDERLKHNTALAALAVSAIASMRSESGEVKAEPKAEVEQKRESVRHLSPKVTSMTETHELAPIQTASPKAEKDNRLTLPSMSDIGLKGAGSVENGGGGHRASFSSHSPPQPPLCPPRDLAHSISKSHGSPPISPPETFRRPLPSPGRPDHYYNSYGPARRPSYVIDALGYANSPPGDYSSSTTETPSMDQSTPGGIPAGINRMSIDGITNPPPGGFVCRYPNCNAQPFQTQYLLNSHANVHSQNRPHYCPVAGCPRAEGGKGFKRKNEMIRHGLVHESPGYVCPYCVDREHKYPRPDNLQRSVNLKVRQDFELTIPRHVRVHHVDKDKDDPLLREVLAQRPEGPSRGRRRRGGNT